MKRFINKSFNLALMRTLDSYIGIEPFMVKVDDSPKLQELAEKARQLRPLSFTEKINGVKNLTIDAMVNAYEQMVIWDEKQKILRRANRVHGNYESTLKHNQAKSHYEKFRKIIFEQHPLSYALMEKSGCCRYQGALFFVLSYEAQLGDKHFIHAAPVNREVNTVFNELLHNGKTDRISIFTSTLKDKSLDYSIQNPNILEQAFEEIPGINMYSYHRMPSGLVIVENPSRHTKLLQE
jgi:hypothetical protein